ncbi:MAG TPA: DNA polymerase/3'-5' exonuclease PolX [Firmicutes bacterium]|nr:DNA polymerase/3'-5' exonuclease PolX [Bacillota bacterium]
MSNKQELAALFNQIGTLLEVRGENPFKARAYYKAAQTIESLETDLDELIRNGQLKEVPGFGPAITQKILEWKETGTIGYYEELKKTTPLGLLDLLRVPGLGPKKIAVLASTLQITDLEMLEEACRENKLLTVPGFGPKTQAKIAAGLEFIRAHQGSFLWMQGMEWAIKFQNALAAHPAVSRVEIAGSLRRCLPLNNRIDLVAASTSPSEVTTFFTSSELENKLELYGKIVIQQTAEESTITFQHDYKVHLIVVPPEEFPFALWFHTGNEGHKQALIQRAAELGYQLRPDGLKKETTRVVCQNEAELYQYLGLAYIPAELRENCGELEAAAANRLPALVEPEDIQGLFHVHTKNSDGLSTLRELVEGAINRGYHYLGIADHSQSAYYAHGLTKEALRRQWEEIDQLNREYPHFRIFKGIESDILPSGELDYDPETLAQFDFVIGSIHSHFQMGEAEMTERILKAMDNPYLTMLGHPSGRILLSRPAYQVNLEPIIEKAAEKGLIIEFNANPFRMDLDWRWCLRAKQLGVPIAINPDAHTVGELDLARLSIPVARKGWLEKSDVFNTKTTAEIAAYFSKKR